MRSYAVSPDNRRVLYTTVGRDGQPHLWIASIDKSSPAELIGQPNDRSPYFGPHGEVLFEFTEGKFNYVGRMNEDGSGRSKVAPYPISFLDGISPGGRWIMPGIPLPNGGKAAPVAIPADGGPPRQVCVSICDPVWSLNGKFLFVPVEPASSTRPGRSLIIPVGPQQDLSGLPPGGIKPMAQASDVPGSQSINRADFVPGKDLEHFAYVKTTMHYNLFRVQMP